MLCKQSVACRELYIMILAVDFDKVLGNLAEYPALDPPKDIHRFVAWYVKRKQKQGWYVILNTCRENGALISALNYLDVFYEFKPDNENANAPWLIEKYGDCRKISCDINIDDKNMGLIGWLLRRLG